MEILNRARAESVYFLARTVGEKLAPDVNLERIPNATLKSADAWDRDKGDFRRSASEFHSVLLAANNVEEEIRAANGVVRELINLGSFRQTRPLLETTIPILIQELPYRRQRIYFEGEINNRLGWIADYESGYFDARDRFERVRSLLSGIPDDERTDEAKHLNHTAIHFLGRAHFGLASQGIRTRLNTQNALGYFQQGLEIDQEERRRGHPNPTTEGFQHAWISRCYQMMRYRHNAWEHLELAGNLFAEASEEIPERGIMAHYYLLRGVFELYDANLGEAETNLKVALTEREKEYYPKGLSDIYLGMAEVYRRRWNFSEAAKFGWKAYKIYPLSLLKTVAGG